MKVGARLRPLFVFLRQRWSGPLLFFARTHRPLAFGIGHKDRLDVLFGGHFLKGCQITASNLLPAC